MKYWFEMNYNEQQKAIAVIVIGIIWMIIGSLITLGIQYMMGG